MSDEDSINNIEITIQDYEDLTEDREIYESTLKVGIGRLEILNNFALPYSDFLTAYNIIKRDTIDSKEEAIREGSLPAGLFATETIRVLETKLKHLLAQKSLEQKFKDDGLTTIH